MFVYELSGCGFESRCGFFFVFFFITYGNTEDIKQRFEQNYYMNYWSIQNVLAIGIKRRKIEDQVNQIVPFYQGDLVKEKMTSPLKVSGVMINAGATTIDSVILFFTEFISMVKNNTLCGSGFFTIIV